MLEPPVDVSSGKVTSFSSDSEYDEAGFEVHINLKSTKPSYVIIKPIPDIPIQTFSPQNLPSNQTCYASEVEHVTLVLLEITSPPETQPPQPSPKFTPHKAPSFVQFQLQGLDVSELHSETEHIIQDLSLVQLTSESKIEYEHIPFDYLHPKTSPNLSAHNNQSYGLT